MVHGVFPQNGDDVGGGAGGGGGGDAGGGGDGSGFVMYGAHLTYLK